MYPSLKAIHPLYMRTDKFSFNMNLNFKTNRPAMSEDKKQNNDTISVSKQEVPAAAIRALKEAEDRRKVEDTDKKLPTEKGGPKGVEPTRFGDWERGGRAVDF